MQQRQPTYLAATALISPLGNTVTENFSAILQQKSGITLLNDARFFPQPILAARIDQEAMDAFHERYQNLTRFDDLMLACAECLRDRSSVDLAEKDTLIILSTTKGNIELLESNIHHPGAALTASANLLQQFLRNPNPVVIVSNACISGVSACIAARRYLQSGQYKNVMVLGCDVVSKFVLSGFQSFKAIARHACRPFDLHRDGVVLGEAAGAMLLSSSSVSSTGIGEGCITNDANHISGPSKTGDELSYCISRVLQKSSLESKDIGFIAAHGTATPYNDEMESKAIAAAGLGEIPLFSVKAHFGHTLGASGVIESIIAAECLQQNRVLPSMGYDIHGVSAKVNVSRQSMSVHAAHALKTSSGFGGCNAAMLISKLT